MSIGLYRIYSLLLIYGIKKLKLAGLRLERFDSKYSPLIHYLVDSLLVPKDCRSSGVKSILIAARCGENLEQQRAKVLSVKRQAGQFRMILSFILSIYILSVKQQALDKYIVMG